MLPDEVPSDCVSREHPLEHVAPYAMPLSHILPTYGEGVDMVVRIPEPIIGG